MISKHPFVQVFDSPELPLRNKTEVLVKKLDEDEVLAAQDSPQFSDQIYTPFPVRV